MLRPFVVVVNRYMFILMTFQIVSDKVGESSSPSVQHPFKPCELV